MTMLTNKKGASPENVRPGQEAPSKNITKHKTFRRFLQSDFAFGLLFGAWLTLNILNLFTGVVK